MHAYSKCQTVRPQLGCRGTHRPNTASRDTPAESRVRLCEKFSIAARPSGCAAELQHGTARVSKRILVCSLQTVRLSEIEALSFV
jgi:hypothetical protein